MIKNFGFEIWLVDGVVRDGNDETNEDLQKLAHILAKLPDQYGELVIEYEFTAGRFGRQNPYDPPGANDEPPEFDFSSAYVECDNRRIRIRPNTAYDLFVRYLDDIETDSVNESIHKIANVITEDPDIFIR